MSFDNDDFITHSNYDIGILGTHGKINKNAIINDIIEPAINEFNISNKIKQISIPFEGESSIYIEDYFERKYSHININICTFDWRKNGPSARKIRDTQIINNASYFIIFLGKTSTHYEKIAETLVKKGKNVITVNYIDYQLTLLEPIVEVKKGKRANKTKSIVDYFNT